MSEFDALLKRSFAEAHEPADDGFVAQVSARVAKREKLAQMRVGTQMLGVAIGLAAAAYGLFELLAVFGPGFAATAGLEIARLHGAVSGGEPVSFAGIAQSMGAGMTQILLITGAVTAGAAVAFRSAQD